ncbi:NAD(P)-binding protein [Martensiomyces pterosporus]|nr:NAD(P)-binding protein [Martensiomyces pterosporus]
MSPPRKLFVVGGSGFLGQAICRSAISRGWEVLSLSRHGAPTGSTAQGSIGSRFMQRVQWIKGDALKPETFREHMEGCAAVVHSVGTLMENDYKKLINVGYSSNASTESTTYERANRDTALSVARVARLTDGLDAFAYISASDVVPFLDPRYISTKREAEAALLEHRDQLRSIILRPGFMFSSSRPVTLPVAAGVEVFRALFNNTPVGCALKNTPLAKAANPAIRRQTVADAVMNSIENPRISGVLEIGDIVRIGSSSRA